MIILAIESSCDETAVALVEDGRRVLADCIASSMEMHKLYGGVVPEIASRKHIEVIAKLADEALAQAGLTRGDIDAVAVTYAPGLIGAVLVGVSFAKSVAAALGVPLIPVHHVRGHIAANYIAYPELEPPFLCLCVSGGTSLIVDVRDYTDMEILGSTRDDAAGECFDKIARVMGLGYPGGGPLDRASQGGNDKAFALPKVHIQDAPLDLSFSGLKTAMLNLIHNAQQKGEELPVADLAASFSAAVSEELVPRTVTAARQVGYGKVAVVGGVAANSRIRRDLETACQKEGWSLYLPPLKLCGDNGSMIGSQGYYEYLAGTRAGSDLNGYANRDISLTYGGTR
jgi:N6-L-threonylcarbamoyladenine synthase